MPFRVSGKNLDIGGALRERISTRIVESLSKYFDGGYSGHVTVEKDGFGFRTECAIHLDSGITLHTDANASPQASGVATFHYGTGNGTTTSTVGETLAGFIQRELVARTGLPDCRTHGRTWDILRMTRCPAMRVEVGYLTNAGDRAKLADPAFRDTVAEGILVAVKRLYLLGENDQPTGTFTFADLIRHELAKAE